MSEDNESGGLSEIRSEVQERTKGCEHWPLFMDGVVDIDDFDAAIIGLVWMSPDDPHIVYDDDALIAIAQNKFLESGSADNEEDAFCLAIDQIYNDSEPECERNNSDGKAAPFILSRIFSADPYGEPFAGKVDLSDVSEILALQKWLKDASSLATDIGSHHFARAAQILGEIADLRREVARLRARLTGQAMSEHNEQQEDAE